MHNLSPRLQKTRLHVWALTGRLLPHAMLVGCSRTSTLRPSSPVEDRMPSSSVAIIAWTLPLTMQYRGRDAFGTGEKANGSMSSWPPVPERPLHELQVPPPTGLRHSPSVVVVAFDSELGAVRMSRRWAAVVRPGARLPIEAAARHPRQRARPPLSVAPEVLHAKPPLSDVEVLRAATSRCSHAHQSTVRHPRHRARLPIRRTPRQSTVATRHRGPPCRRVEVPACPSRPPVPPRRGARMPIKAACAARRGCPRLRGRCRHGRLRRPSRPPSPPGPLLPWPPGTAIPMTSALSRCGRACGRHPCSLPCLLGCVVGDEDLTQLLHKLFMEDKCHFASSNCIVLLDSASHLDFCVTVWESLLQNLCSRGCSCGVAIYDWFSVFWGPQHITTFRCSSIFTFHLITAFWCSSIFAFCFNEFLSS
jgi:hypothetical protein